MDIVRRNRGVPAPGGVECERCKRSLPQGAFGASEKMVGGLFPWCIECSKVRTASSETRVTYQKAYMRSYMKRRRADGIGPDARVAWLTLVIQGRGKMLARWSAARSSVRITGSFGLREDALRVLTSAFCVDVSEVIEAGAGAGRGFRRQKTFSTVGPVDRAEWEAGKALLIEAGAAREGKG